MQDPLATSLNAQLDPFKILVLGSGGRENAICKKLSQDASVQVFCVPGNAGCSNPLPLDPLNFDELLSLCSKNRISMIFVGPEAPLVEGEGIVDYFAQKAPGIAVLGPNKNAAQLEASKSFSANFMQDFNIPHGKSRLANSFEEVQKIIDEHPLPIVIKADGLAAGKGVSIHHSRKEALEKAKQILAGSLGDAGLKIVFQEFLSGKEASLFILCNGKEGIYLPTAQDYKLLGDGNLGPNTGGMGSFSPGEYLNADHIRWIDQNITAKVLTKFSYKGILYIGLMVHDKKKVSVVEFNCRLGDPETQSVLPRFEPSLIPYLQWASGLRAFVPKMDCGGYYSIPEKPLHSLNVVVVSNGYPGKYEKGVKINLPNPEKFDVSLIHAGIKKENSTLLSNGGRLFNVVGLGKSREEAREKVYNYLEEFSEFNSQESFFYRKDIGKL